MIKIFLIFTLGLTINLNFNHKKAVVIDFTRAIKIKKGYNLVDADSTFTFRRTTYLIQSKATFDDNGEIINAFILGDIGYTIYTKEHFQKFKNLFSEYNLPRVAKLYVIDSRHIRLNNETIIVEKIDQSKKVIFFTLKEKDIIYRVKFK